MKRSLKRGYGGEPDAKATIIEPLAKFILSDEPGEYDAEDIVLGGSSFRKWGRRHLEKRCGTTDLVSSDYHWRRVVASTQRMSLRTVRDVAGLANGSNLAGELSNDVNILKAHLMDAYHFHNGNDGKADRTTHSNYALLTAQQFTSHIDHGTNMTSTWFRVLYNLA
eukprot:gene13508-3945_t